MRLAVMVACMLVGCSGGDGGADSDGGDASGPTADAMPRPDVIPGEGTALQFFGQGGLYGDRVRVVVDDPSESVSSPAIDVGATDFTIEFWMRASAADNTNSIVCEGNNWVMSNIIVDRDRHGGSQSFGVGLSDGTIVWNVSGDFDQRLTLCGTTNVLDDAWHHIAVQRQSDGLMQIFVDGVLDASDMGPPGDVSYPDDGVVYDSCPSGGPCDYSDPYLVFGAEKHGYPDISYRGLLDELRVSTVLRYPAPAPTTRFVADADTVGLYRFDEGQGESTADDSGLGHTGELVLGGDPLGPQWSTDSRF